MLQRFIGSFRAPIFLYLVLFSQIVSAQLLLNNLQLDQAAKSDQWLALLHLSNGNPTIEDPNFILSIQNFSPRNELMKTIKFFTENQALNASSACRFIARADYIQRVLNIDLNFDDSKCLEYREFLLKAPADKVSIIYASENLTQPSSMLGHSMLAISGKNDSNIFVEHGVSFFTELDTINLASILWDTLYLGKKAFFVIEPLSKSLNYYLRNEQRNIWQYEIDLSDDEKTLLHKHLWELRTLDMDYFFHRHNCATFSFDVLAVARPSLLAYRQSWITPIDVVKAAEEAKIIAEIQVYPSNKWKIRMLTDFISDAELLALENLIFNDAAIAKSSLLSKEMVKAFNQYSLEVGDIDKQEWDKNQQAWLLNAEDGSSLEINNYKSPSYSPGDSAYHVAIENFNNEQSLLVGWLPTSHALEDDNRQYFGETELKLSELVFRTRLYDAEIDLYRWDIYSATSLTPRNQFTGGLSGRFGFGLDQFLFDDRGTSLAAYLTGSLGVTHKVNNDMSYYYLANIGQVSNLNDSYAYASPEIGAFIYEVFNMKSMVSIKREFRSTLEVVNYYSFKQSVFLAENSLLADATLIQLAGSDLFKVGFQYRVYF